MRAFLRFRELAGPDGAHYVGWYEPAHYVLEEVAQFLTGRIGDLCWSILTQAASAHWNGTLLMFGPGADPARAGDDTALEQLWRGSFARPGAAWRNSPGAAALPELVRETLQATEEMAVTLRRSAYSTNIKTRADFSCAFFDRDLRAVAQAFTQPVHLGSMSESRRVRSYRQATGLKPVSWVVDSVGRACTRRGVPRAPRRKTVA